MTRCTDLLSHWQEDFPELLLKNNEDEGWCTSTRMTEQCWAEPEAPSLFLPQIVYEYQTFPARNPGLLDLNFILFSSSLWLLPLHGKHKWKRKNNRLIVQFANQYCKELFRDFLHAGYTATWTIPCCWCNDTGHFYNNVDKKIQYQ